MDFVANSVLRRMSKEGNLRDDVGGPFCNSFGAGSTEDTNRLIESSTRLLRRSVGC